jgi:hypothetical protein
MIINDSDANLRRGRRGSRMSRVLAAADSRFDARDPHISDIWNVAGGPVAWAIGVMCRFGVFSA